MIKWANRENKHTHQYQQQIGKILILNHRSIGAQNMERFIKEQIILKPFQIFINLHITVKSMALHQNPWASSRKN
jgi:hypothetical protein